jgi:hypothetical protein
MHVRTSVQKFAVIFGVVYALLGFLGFLPTVLQPPPADAPSLTVDAYYTYLLGTFPLNALHNLVHVATGVVGIVSASTFSAARLYSRTVSIVFGALTVMGLLPALNTTLGLIPIFGADVLLHVLTTLVSAYFGWFAGDARATRTHAATARG